MASAAQHYSWLEEYYPALFSKVHDKISGGQMEVNGGCWVEMDGNLPSGESLCRQFLYGQRYFRSRFGKTTDVLVLPDTCKYRPNVEVVTDFQSASPRKSRRLPVSAVAPASSRTSSIGTP